MVELKQVCVDCVTTRTKGTYFVTESVPLIRVAAAGGAVYYAGEWIILRAQEVSSNGTQISGEYDLVLEDV